MFKGTLEMYRHLADSNLQLYESNIADILFCLAFNSIFICKYVESEQYARNGLEIDATNSLLYSNLAHSLLFQEKFDEAELIYCRCKDEFLETFLSDFE